MRKLCTMLAALFLLSIGQIVAQSFHHEANALELGKRMSSGGMPASCPQRLCVALKCNEFQGRQE